uniref:winged helix-turn-helix transcriptional regulator n=1 Tax=Novacetimonas pomaceti TaxID=2021998 RepID=UPI0030B8DBCE
MEYSLTLRGRTLEPVIMALKKWGDENTGFRRDPESPADLDEPAADCPVSCVRASG